MRQTTHKRTSIVMLLATLAGPMYVAAMQATQSDLPRDEKKAISEFEGRARDYEKTVQALPANKLKATSDVMRLEKERASLREAIQQARPNAKQGDLFTEDVAQAFRDVLKQTVNGADGTKIKASLKHAEPTPPADLAVNHEYPNQQGQPVQSVPPSLLQHLPPLPKGLEYRIAGRMLALRDREANLVVDYLPDALP